MMRPVSFIMFFGFFCCAAEVLANFRKPVVEQIYGVEMTNNGPVFQVFTGGCTVKDDFEIEILGADPVLLRLWRLSPDDCKAYYPYGIKVSFTFDELGLAPFSYFKVLNPRRVVQVVK